MVTTERLEEMLKNHCGSDSELTAVLKELIARRAAYFTINADDFIAEDFMDLMDAASKELKKEFSQMQYCIDVDSTDIGYYEKNEAFIKVLCKLQILAESLKQHVEPKPAKRLFAMQLVIEKIKTNQKEGLL